MVGEPGADRNVYPTRDGVSLSGPHLESVEIGVGIGIGIGADWNDRVSGHANTDSDRTAIAP